MIVLGSSKKGDKVSCLECEEGIHLGNMPWSPGILGQCPESFTTLQACSDNTSGAG